MTLPAVSLPRLHDDKHTKELSYEYQEHFARLLGFVDEVPLVGCTDRSERPAFFGHIVQKQRRGDKTTAYSS